MNSWCGGGGDGSSSLYTLSLGEIGERGIDLVKHLLKITVNLVGWSGCSELLRCWFISSLSSSLLANI